MRFTKSQRKLHANNNFNPPCNVYQKDTSTLKLQKSDKILTGSLATPSTLSLLTNKNTFGFCSRFGTNSIYKNDNTPGPGTHEILPTQIKRLNVDNKIVKGKYFASSNSPSIPYSYYGQNPDQQEELYIRQIEMNSNLDESYKKLNKSSAGYTFAKNSPKYPTYMQLASNLRQQANAQAEQLYEAEQDKNINKESGSHKMGSVSVTQKIRQSSNRRLQVIQMISPDYVPSLQLIELIKKRKKKENPGPADYYPHGYDKEYVLVQKNKSAIKQVEQDGEQENGDKNNNSALKQLNCQEQYQYYDISGNKSGPSFPTAKRFIDYDKINWNNTGPGQYNAQVTKNACKATYSFGKSDRKLFEGKCEGQFRFYIDHDHGSGIVNGVRQKQSISKPMKGGCLYEQVCESSRGVHFQGNNRGRSDSCPFGSGSVRFENIKLGGGQRLTLMEEKQVKNKQKLNKMIRTRMILHKKMNTHSHQKDQGLLALSTIASTIN